MIMNHLFPAVYSLPLFLSLSSFSLHSLINVYFSPLKTCKLINPNIKKERTKREFKRKKKVAEVVTKWYNDCVLPAKREGIQTGVILINECNY